MKKFICMTPVTRPKFFDRDGDTYELENSLSSDLVTQLRAKNLKAALVTINDVDYVVRDYDSYEDGDVFVFDLEANELIRWVEPVRDSSDSTDSRKMLLAATIGFVTGRVTKRKKNA